MENDECKNCTKLAMTQEQLSNVIAELRELKDAKDLEDAYERRNRQNLEITERRITQYHERYHKEIESVLYYLHKINNILDEK